MIGLIKDRSWRSWQLSGINDARIGLLMNLPPPVPLASHPRIGAEDASLPPILLLGRDPRLPAGDWPCTFATLTDAPFEALIVVDQTAALDAEALLRRRCAWLAPVADLSGFGLWFADVKGNDASAASLRTAVEGLLRILDRQHTLPAPITRSEDPASVLLARVYSRGGSLRPVYDGNARELLRLPDAGLLDAPAGLAQRLAEDGWFTRTLFDRVHVCPSCGSSRLNVREQCSACRSADVAEETLVHHFRCGHQAVEGQFKQTDALVCPKCRRALRHFGVDYDRPGAVSTCRSCGHVDADPAIGFVCVDCGALHPGEHVSTRDWFSYALTELAEARLLSGDLRALRNSGETRIFQALAEHWMRIQSRYGRPAIVLRLAFTRAEEAMQQGGSRAVMLAKQQVLEIVRGELRETDILVEAPDGLLIVMPETDAAAVEIPRRRLHDRITSTLALDLGIELRPIEAKEITRKASQP